MFVGAHVTFVTDCRRTTLIFVNRNRTYFLFQIKCRNRLATLACLRGEILAVAAS